MLCSMDGAIFSYHGTNRQNQARRYVVRQVAEPVDVAGHGPLQSTGSLARQAVLLGRSRTRRRAGTRRSQRANRPLAAGPNFYINTITAANPIEFFSKQVYIHRELRERERTLLSCHGIALMRARAVPHDAATHRAVPDPYV